MASSLSRNNGYVKSSYSDPGYETQNGGYFPLDPVDGYDGFGGSEGYQASYSYPPAASLGGGASYGWGPQTTGRTSNMRLPPQQFQAGELLRSEVIHEDGDSESETRERYYVDDPTSATYGFQFQPGELTNIESFYEGGNYEEETRERGRPDGQTEEAQMAVSVGEELVDPALSPADGNPTVLSSLHNLLLLYKSGLLYPGTMQHYASEYAEGQDEREEVQEQRYGSYWCEPLNIATILMVKKKTATGMPL